MTSLVSEECVYLLSGGTVIDCELITDVKSLTVIQIKITGIGNGFWRRSARDSRKVKSTKP
jgi:hypothetical protein